jgi:hypothetical protein
MQLTLTGDNTNHLYFMANGQKENLKYMREYKYVRTYKYKSPRTVAENIKKQQRQLVRVSLSFLIIGLCLILIPCTILFAYGRPFDKFVYYKCSTWGKDVFRVDQNTVKVVYYVDSVRYEKLLNDEFDVFVDFYYNKNNPDDVITTNRAQLLELAIFSSTFGCVLLISMKIISNGEKKKWRDCKKSKTHLILICHINHLVKVMHKQKMRP